MLILIYLFLIRVIFCLNLKINEEIILKTPIESEVIGAGLRNLLEEGDYLGLTQLLRLNRIDVPKIYLNAIGNDQIPFLFLAFNFYNEGFMTQEDAKSIIPAKIVSDHSTMSSLLEIEVKKLPENPLANEYLFAYSLNENALIAALKRGLKEKDPLMTWTTWPLETPIGYSQVWSQTELWRILLIETFCNAQFDIKNELLKILRSALSQPISVDELLMLNISLFSFHLEILRLKEYFSKNSEECHGKYLTALKSLENKSLSIFLAIKSQSTLDLFDGFDVNSVENLLKSSTDLFQNRIELFTSVIKRLEEAPNVFADWFCNLFFSFDDVLPIMSAKLLLDSWKLFLSFHPTVEAICNLLNWFGGRINEDYRFTLAQEIPDNLLPLYYRKCRIKNNVPMPLELIPYELRESEYLKKARGGSSVTFTYELESFWMPQQKPIIKILKLFDYINSVEVDLYESIDTYFNLGTTGKHIGLSKFLEMILNLFLDINEWYIILKKASDSVLEIIPSPLFPPKFVTILVQIIVRCRHLSCKYPFKISEKYFKMAIYGFSAAANQKFVQSQMKYLTNSNQNRLPRLTKYYKIYFSELKRIQGQSDYDENLFRDYYNLHGKLKTLWTAAESSYNWDMIPTQLEEVEIILMETVSTSIEHFGLELNRIVGPVTFSETEIYNFLFN